MSDILDKVELALFDGILNVSVINNIFYDNKEILFKNKLLSRQNRLMMKTLHKFIKAHKLRITKCSRNHIHRL